MTAIPPYKITGTGPALVLVHNGFYSQASFDKIRTMMEPSYTIISFDRSGYGRAVDLDASNTGLDSGVAELAALVEGLEKQGLLSGPINLAGHCMGGAIALHYAAANPTKVRRLVLEGTGFKTEAEITTRVDLVMRPWEFVPAYMKRLLATMHGHDYAPKMWEYIINHRESYVLAPNYSSLGIHGQVACPVLIIQGQDDIFFNPEQAHRGAAAFADCTTIILPDTGHDVHRERPSVWVQAVRDFI